MLSRRAILTTGGASIVLLGGGYAASVAGHNSSTREPWSAAREGFGDVRLNALAYAILAPNPHNRQPWMVKLAERTDHLSVYCDLDRLLPETDPPNRQITIGLGAFLELFSQAASEQGYKTDIDMFPEGEPYPVLDNRPIAHIKISEDITVKPDPLFKYSLARRTVRINFNEGQPVENETLDLLASTAQISNSTQFVTSIDVDEIERIKSLCRDGWAIETGTKRTHYESTKLTRIGAKEVSKNPDGIALMGPMMEAYKVMGILKRDKMNTPGSAAFEGTISFYNGLIDSAGAFGWLVTLGNTRKDQLRVGADWVRLNLAATKLGLAMHPISQVLQEFPEMADLYNQFHELVEVEAPARVQGLFRFGFAEYPKAAPRWPLESRLSRF